MKSKHRTTKVGYIIINKGVGNGGHNTTAILTQAFNMADNFVSNVERLKRREKYNVNHLNQLAEFFIIRPGIFFT